MNWQPIETAPKDGTIVLAWDGRAVYVAFYGRYALWNEMSWIGGHCKVAHITQPTHWMPLPEPPKGGAERVALREPIIQSQQYNDEVYKDGA
jgi:hypothetical protein